MATLTQNTQLTVAEVVKRKDPRNGNAITMAEELSRKNAILIDAPWIEGNEFLGHKTVRRVSQPAGQRRRINASISTSASTSEVFNDVIYQLADYCVVDKTLAQASGDIAGFRNQENIGFINGMGITLAYDVFYGNNNTDDTSMHGIAARTNTLDGKLIVGGGGSGGDTTSIYVVSWDPMYGCKLVYPRGTSAGLTMDDKGLSTEVTSSGRREVYTTYYEVMCGLVVPDRRYLGRYANIETSGTTNTFDEDNLITILNQMEGDNKVIYCNRTIFTQMDIKAKDKINALYGVENVFGVPTVTFRGIPVRLCEAIVNTEAAVS